VVIMSLDRARPKFHRTGAAYQAAALVVVFAAQQPRHRAVDEIGIAVIFLAIGKGKLRTLGDEVNKFGSDRIEPRQIDPPEQRKLLQRYRTLRPWTGLHDLQRSG